MPFVAQQNHNATGSHVSLVNRDAKVQSRSNEIRKHHQSSGFDEESRVLFRQLGRGEFPQSAGQVKSSGGSCFSRTCQSHAGRMGDVECRDIKFQDLCKNGEIWDNLSIGRQVELIKPALKPSGRHIDPRSPYMRWWDFIVLGALVHTAVITPYEVALINQSFGVLFVINCMVDAIFVKDMFMQFFLKIRVKKISGSTRWIRSTRALAAHYLKGWFFLDLVSVLPVDHIIALFLGRGNDNAQKARALRVLRIVRLVKLARVFRASRVLQRWENVIVLPFSTQALLRFIVAIVTLSHWMACAWALFGRMLATNMVCRDGVLIEILSEPDGQSWLTLRSWPPDNPCTSLHVYAAALHFSVMTITSIGYGDVAPTRSEEYLVGIACQLIGAITWAYIIGSACGVIANVDPEGTMHKQEMDELNHMLKRQNISPPLRHRLRRYMAEVIHHKKVVRSRELCQDFSPDLRGELVMSTPIGRAITNVWYFTGCEDTFLVEVAQGMIPRFFAKQEVCSEVIGMLGICQRGAVARNGRIFLTGRFWGEDMILNSDDLREMYPVISLTYSEVLTLSRNILFAIVRDGLAGSSRKRLSRAAMIIAIFKSTKIVSQEREREEHTHHRLHQLLEEAKVVGRAVDAAGGFYMFSNADAKVLTAKHRGEMEVGDHDSVSIEPFHKVVVQELRSIQRCCAQDFQALARRAAGCGDAPGITVAVPPVRGDHGSPRAEHLDEPSAPLDLEGLHLHVADGSRGEDNEPASPEALAELAAYVQTLSQQLSRLGVLTQSHHPEPPPEPPPSSESANLRPLGLLEREDSASPLPSPSAAGRANSFLSSRAGCSASNERTMALNSTSTISSF